MRHAQVLRFGGCVLLVGWAMGTTGCIHNHYYGQGVPVCDTTAPSATTSHYGAVCEVPEGAAIVTQGPGRVTTIGSPSRVVINSEPMGVRPETRGAARYGWKRSEPGLASSRVEGGIDDDTVTK